MSRSNYSDDCENIALYRGTVARAISGKRGQAFLRDLLAALDALPEKTLIAGELVAPSGACCAIGAVCKARSVDVSRIDYYDPRAVGKVVGISTAMAAEIEYENDKAGKSKEDPASRWVRMRRWVVDNLNNPAQPTP